MPYNAELISRRVPLGSSVQFTLRTGEKAVGILHEVTDLDVLLENPSQAFLLEEIAGFQILEASELPTKGNSASEEVEKLDAFARQYIDSYNLSIEEAITNLIDLNKEKVLQLSSKISHAELAEDLRKIVGKAERTQLENGNAEHYIEWINRQTDAVLSAADKLFLCGLLLSLQGRGNEAYDAFVQLVLTTQDSDAWGNLAFASLIIDFKPMVYFSIQNYFTIAPEEKVARLLPMYVALNFKERYKYKDYSDIAALIDRMGQGAKLQALVDAVKVILYFSDSTTEAVSLQTNWNQDDLLTVWKKFDYTPVSYYMRFKQCWQLISDAKAFTTYEMDAMRTGLMYEYVNTRWFGFILGRDWRNYWLHNSRFSDMGLLSTVQSFDWRGATEDPSEIIEVNFEADLDDPMNPKAKAIRLSRGAGHKRYISSASRKSAVQGKIEKYNGADSGVVITDDGSRYSFKLSPSMSAEHRRAIRENLRVEFQIFRDVVMAEVMINGKPPRYSNYTSNGLVRELSRSGSFYGKVVSDTGAVFALKPKTRFPFQAPKVGDHIYFNYFEYAKITSTLPTDPESGQNSNNSLNREPAASGGRRMFADAEQYFVQATLLREKGDLKGAELAYEQAMSHELHVNIIIAYAKMVENDFSKAESLYLRGIEKFPDQAILYQSYAKILRQHRKLSEAADILRKGIAVIQSRQGTTAQNLYYPLANILADINTEESLREAVEYAQKAIDEAKITETVLSPKIRLLLAQHHSSDNSAASAWDITKVIPFFVQAGFKEEVRYTADKDFADIKLAATDPVYKESYNLRSLVIRYFIKPTSLKTADIENLSQELLNGKYVNLDGVAIIVSADAQNWQDELLARVAHKPYTIIPIAPEHISNRGEMLPSRFLRDILNQWLARRDLFDGRNPVVGREFYGREKQLQELSLNIEDGQHTGLYGLRKVGKTSLLKQIGVKRPHDIFAFVALENLNDRKDCKYIYHTIAKSVWEAMHSNSALAKTEFPKSQLSFIGKVEISQLAGMSSEQAAKLFAQDMELVFERITANNLRTKLIIAIDETELMLPFIAGERGFTGYDKFFAHIRGMGQQTAGRVVSIIAAANPLLSEISLLEKRDNPVFQMYKPMYLPPFPVNEFEEMIRMLAKGMLVDFDDTAIHSIYDKTGGFPYIARQFCSYIIASRKEQRPLLVSIVDVEQQVRRFVRDNGDIFSEIINRLQQHFPEEEAILRLIAYGKNDEAAISRHTGINAGMDQALRHLFGYNLISEVESGYVVKIDLLRLWIQRNFPSEEGGQ